jgi:hypothetical protein
MQIFDERFQAGQLPTGWYTDTAFPRYEKGAWDCHGWDGVIVPLPHEAWRRLQVDVELDQIQTGATAFCGTDSRTALHISLLPATTPRHQAGDGGYTILQSTVPVPLENGTTHLGFEWTDKTLRVRSGTVDLLFAPNLRGSARAGTVHMGFSKCRVRQVIATGEPLDPVPPRPQAIQTGYPLEVTVDFNDDLMACAWTHKTFESLFTELKSWGTRRVSWIDLGRKADEYFDFAPLSIAKHARDTFSAVGDIFTAAVDHAHRQGIELIGLLKPLDMAIQGYSWPPFSEQARKHGRIHRIGNSSGWVSRMAADNQHLLTTRKPSVHGPGHNAIWTRIELVKDDAEPAAFTPDQVTFMVSNDNNTYRPYDGPIHRHEQVEERSIYQSTPSGPRPTAEKRRVRVFRFDGLILRDPFMVITIDGDQRSFSNRLCDLVHIYGDQGEETRITYGLSRRRDDHATRFNWGPDQATGGSIPGYPGGFEFNRYPGSPSINMMSGGDPINTPLVLDRGLGSFLALARGKDRSPLAIMSPSFPETRKLWMTWVEAMLDSGADGIDIRPGSHHADFAWIEYGFEEPVRHEMLRQTGIDIWETDAFDYDLWRRIRGEGWTQFIREAAAVVHGRGKTLALHIDSFFDGAPGTGGGLNIVCDWRSWLNEGLADRVTGKSLWPDAQFSREVLALAHAKGIPVTYAPYCNNFFEDRRSTNHIGDSPKGCEIPVARLMEWGRQSGYDSFLFYECASALRAKSDGTLHFRHNAEPLRRVLQEQFGSSVTEGMD